MDAMTTFLITFGIVGLLHGADKDSPEAAAPAEPASAVTTARVEPGELRERRLRYELTNDWLRQLRRIVPEIEERTPLRTAKR